MRYSPLYSGPSSNSNSGSSAARLISSNPRARCVLAFILCLFFIYFFKSLLFPKPDPCMVLDKVTPRGENPGLPKIIHQQWKNRDALPARHQNWQNKVKLTFPQHQYLLWTDEEMRELIQNDYPDFLPTYDALPRNIMRVDAARCFILHKFGGLYLDMDYEVLDDFWDRLPGDRPAVIQSFSHYLETTQNSLMSSPPKHEFWEHTWRLMKERAKSGSTDPIYVTGPKLIDQAVLDYEKQQKREQVLILPCENWQRVTWGEEGLIHTVWKMLASALGVFKDCGDVRNARCQVGIHHGTTMWF